MKESSMVKAPESKKFSSDWWNDFVENTHNLKKTTVFNDCLTREETAQMRQCLMDIVMQLSQMRSTHFGYRVFLDGHQLDYKNMEVVYDKTPLPNESVNEWADRSFGDRKFGMIINRGEKFSPKLAEMVSEKIEPILKKIGVPRLGITFTIFIGNYGWTPIGIHTDATGENVLHFHLGPGRKTMYTWNKEEYEKNTEPVDRLNNLEIDKYLDYANEYDFGEGDLYFMPEGEYHVGRSDDLSMGLTLWFNNHTTDQLSRRAIQVIMDQYLQENSNILLPDTNAVEDLNGFDEALSLFQIPEEYENLTFKEVLKEAYRDFRYSLYSNGGFWTRPFPIEQNYEFTHDTIVQKNPVYDILTSLSPDGSKIYLHIRGTKLVFNNHPCIKSLIDELNKGEKKTVAELLKLLDASWDEGIGFYILNSIYQHHGINICK